VAKSSLYVDINPDLSEQHQDEFLKTVTLGVPFYIRNKIVSGLWAVPNLGYVSTKRWEPLI